ncbi:unnamed protein product [Allacma fusca]|uniref:Uncharacterized protein n=1 Tax=Allacma fusca TaxID=39272 RepID=A0A8J2NXC8_9HEXA|nr:unnamed protein product [Allacma fusca]
MSFTERSPSKLNSINVHRRGHPPDASTQLQSSNLKRSREAVQTEVEKLEISLRDSLQQIEARVDDLEGKNADLEAENEELIKKIKLLKQELIETQKEQLKELETKFYKYQTRNNVVISGMQETVEGTNKTIAEKPIHFARSTLGIENLRVD